MRWDRTLDRTILAIALPAMLTNVATALFGLADVWVIGRLGDVTAQGGVEIGSKLITAVLLLFNFLRSSTVALTARTAGQADGEAQAQVLVRALALALVIGLLLLLAMPVVIPVGLNLYGASGAVAHQAQAYATLRYWSGLPWLLNAALTGWLVGQRRVRSVLAVEVGSNLLHVALDTGFVLRLGLGVSGVAAATLCSETAKLLALCFLAGQAGAARLAPQVLRRGETWRIEALASVLRLNRDLFGRTLLLMGALALLTRAGARQGAVVLAANAILYQLFILSALLLDGFESAAQVLCGEALGAGAPEAFSRLVRRILGWAAQFALIIAGLYALAGPSLARSFSTAPQVVATVDRYIGWAVLMPLVGFASYVLDGVFVGAGWTRAMLATMAAALFVFVAALVLVRPFGDGGLWFAFCFFLLLRGAGQLAALPSLVRSSLGRQGLRPAC